MTVDQVVEAALQLVVAVPVKVIPTEAPMLYSQEDLERVAESVRDACADIIGFAAPSKRSAHGEGYRVARDDAARILRAYPVGELLERAAELARRKKT